MSIYRCAHCDRYHDADHDGCQEAPEYGKFAMVSDECRADMDESRVCEMRLPSDRTILRQEEDIALLCKERYELREVLKSVAAEYLDFNKLSGSTQIMIANVLDSTRANADKET